MESEEATIGPFAQVEEQVRAFKIHQRLRLADADLQDQLDDFVFHFDTRWNTMTAVWWGAGSLCAYGLLTWGLTSDLPWWPLFIVPMIGLAGWATVFLFRHHPQTTGSGPTRMAASKSATKARRILDFWAVFGTLSAAVAIKVLTSPDDVGGRGIAFLVLMAFIGGVRIPGRIATFSIGVGLLVLQLMDWSVFGPGSGASTQLSRAWAAGVGALFVGTGVTCLVTYRRKKALSLLWVRGKSLEAEVEARKRAERNLVLESDKLKKTIRSFSTSIQSHAQELMRKRGTPDPAGEADAFHSEIIGSVQSEVPEAEALIESVIEESGTD